MIQIVKTLHGSHLYGLNTPTSDHDYKVVYIPEIEELILETQVTKSRHSTKVGSGKNAASDVDTEYITLRKFLTDLAAGQSYAQEILFTPDSLILESNPFWKRVQFYAPKLISKNIAPYIGYARQQAAKYGIKGSRLGDLIAVIKILEGLPLHDRLSQHVEALKQPLEVIENASVDGEFLIVLSKKLDLKSTVKHCLQILQHTKNKYGDRAEKSRVNDSVDFKACSHAMRVLYQGEELLTTGKLEFPSNKASKLSLVKAGKVPYSDVEADIVDGFLRLKKIQEESFLPEAVDHGMIDYLVLEAYKHFYYPTERK